MVCARFIIQGRVQGVFFRASARAEAQRLGLIGHAKNLDDGSVEVLACGDLPAVERLAAWLEQGPPAARVERVARSEVAEMPVGAAIFRAL